MQTTIAASNAVHTCSGTAPGDMECTFLPAARRRDTSAARRQKCDSSKISGHMVAAKIFFAIFAAN